MKNIHCVVYFKLSLCLHDFPMTGHFTKPAVEWKLKSGRFFRECVQLTWNVFSPRACQRRFYTTVLFFSFFICILVAWIPCFCNTVISHVWIPDITTVYDCFHFLYSLLYYIHVITDYVAHWFGAKQLQLLLSLTTHGLDMWIHWTFGQRMSKCMGIDERMNAAC